MATDTIEYVKEARTMAARLRLMREQRGLGVNELNRLVRLPGDKRLSDGYISSIETGRRTECPAQYATAIASALGVSAEWLIDGRGPRSFGSGESPAMTTAARDDKPNLERVLEASNIRGRWSVQTVAAARATDVDRPLEAWPDILDRIEKALAPVLKRHR